ncbi:phosphopyruvate hydratase [Candidatus Falkowbacteria bacterium CG10_big_fil_rev_8_21_14_0_10_43_10]|uniref:Enolase n=1 Tax=Candidatus Falkowbacteria bacterium CG10_big_fil_rev_8_21_14_0_10_43_10 TaxID=1974567 RepID=A0A2H0V4E0_9BACT|nr:MAG: phosphopyruvate hydratase [Candidatus Falkowbacteria bacterium CG10_big_fil_rev_8_21_14_0_10_43_10]
MSEIKNITAREILDSRGNPTVECQVELENGIKAKASVPSGASTGEHEAHELRDGDEKRYGGLGVLKAVKNVEEKIAPELEGTDCTKQEEIDAKMIKLDGTKNKKKLGANAILAVSLACARAASIAEGKELYEYINENYELGIKNYELPIPSFNIFNGGRHADTNLDFQEFMIMPAPPLNLPLSKGEKKEGVRSFAEQVRMGAEIFHELGRVLKEAGFDTDTGSEGGYAPDIYSSVQAMEFILAATVRAGYQVGRDIGLGIDVGSSELYDIRTRKYIFKLDQANFANSTLVDLYHEWLKKFNVISIEDGLAQDDWEGWEELTQMLGKEIMIVGDDLFATNVERLKKGIKKKVANTILIKPNQAGTLTETIECVKLAKKNGYGVFVSHRSGETADDFIADLSVAVQADYVKFGSLSRGERVCKYNRMMEIEKLVNQS